MNVLYHSDWRNAAGHGNLMRKDRPARALGGHGGRSAGIRKPCIRMENQAMLEAWPKQAARVDRAGLAQFAARIAAKHSLSEMTFLCIGTDRSSGDCLGP